LGEKIPNFYYHNKNWKKEKEGEPLEFQTGDISLNFEYI
jgi:hypothetical protein